MDLGLGSSCCLLSLSWLTTQFRHKCTNSLALLKGLGQIEQWKAGAKKNLKVTNQVPRIDTKSILYSKN